MNLSARLPEVTMIRSKDEETRRFVLPNCYNLSGTLDFHHFCGDKYFSSGVLRAITIKAEALSKRHLSLRGVNVNQYSALVARRPIGKNELSGCSAKISILALRNASYFCVMRCLFLRDCGSCHHWSQIFWRIGLPKEKSLRIIGGVERRGLGDRRIPGKDE